jgi:hypothetical protein
VLWSDGNTYFNFTTFEKDFSDLDCDGEDLKQFELPLNISKVVLWWEDEDA